MITSSTPPMRAGWYPDPAENVQRYWDGSAWTEHTAPAGVAVPGGAKASGNGFAIAALVLGIASLLINTYGIPSILAIIFGAIGIGRGKVTRVNLPLAIAGLALGIVGLVLIYVLTGRFFGLSFGAR